MSIVAASSFKAVVEQDAGLRADTLSSYQNGGFPAVAVLAAGLGFSFGPADVQSVMSIRAAEGEQSDLELEAVAGGKNAGKAATNATNAVNTVGSFLNPIDQINGAVKGVTAAYNTVNTVRGWIR